MTYKKKFGYVVMYLLLLVVLLSSPGCGGGGKSSSRTRKNVAKFTVTFDSCGGSEVEALTVNSGDVVEKPDNPIRESYIFAD